MNAHNGGGYSILHSTILHLQWYTLDGVKEHYVCHYFDHKVCVVFLSMMLNGPRQAAWGILLYGMHLLGTRTKLFICYYFRNTLLNVVSQKCVDYCCWCHVKYNCVLIYRMPQQSGKQNFWSSHPKTSVPYMFFTKFHSPRPIFHSPSSKCTHIGERVSVSFPHCSNNVPWLITQPCLCCFCMSHIIQGWFLRPANEDVVTK